MGHVLAWAVEHDLDTAVRLVAALGWWWMLRGRLAGQEPLLRELAGRAEPGSDGMVRRAVLARPGPRSTRPTCPRRCSGAPRSST